MHARGNRIRQSDAQQSNITDDSGYHAVEMSFRGTQGYQENAENNYINDAGLYWEEVNEEDEMMEQSDSDYQQYFTDGNVVV